MPAPDALESLLNTGPRDDSLGGPVHPVPLPGAAGRRAGGLLGAGRACGAEGDGGGQTFERPLARNIAHGCPFRHFRFWIAPSVFLNSRLAQQLPRLRDSPA